VDSVGVSLLLLLVAEELEDADEEVHKVEEELEGVVRHVLVSHLGLPDHDLSIVNSVAREDDDSKEGERGLRRWCVVEEGRE